MKVFVTFFFLTISLNLVSQILPTDPIVIPIRSYNYYVINEDGKTKHFYNSKESVVLDGNYEILIFKEDKDIGDAEINKKGTIIRTTQYDLKYTNFINTRLQQEGSFTNGFKNGLWKTFYENKLVKIENYNNGLISGDYRVYNTEGKLLYKTTFDSLGNGKHQDYYYNTGVLKEEGHYENGKKHTEWHSFDEKGKIVKSTFYNEGTIEE